jgi:hypothetical protein
MSGITVPGRFGARVGDTILMAEEATELRNRVAAGASGDLRAA